MIPSLVGFDRWDGIGLNWMAPYVASSATRGSNRARFHVAPRGLQQLSLPLRARATASNRLVDVPTPPHPTPPYPADDEFDARLQRQRWQRRRHRRLASQDIARLDECTLGPNRCAPHLCCMANMGQHSRLRAVLLLPSCETLATSTPVNSLTCRSSPKGSSASLACHGACSVGSGTHSFNTTLASCPCSHLPLQALRAAAHSCAAGMSQSRGLPNWLGR